MWRGSSRLTSAGCGLRDLHDQIRSAKHLSRIRDDRRALGDVVGIGDRGSIARPSLHEYAVPGVDELAHARRRQRNPVLIGLDLCRDTNAHTETTPGHASSSWPRGAGDTSLPSRALWRIAAPGLRTSMFEVCAPADRDDDVGTGSIESCQTIPCRLGLL
jgi:hypothetical protein